MALHWNSGNDCSLGERLAPRARGVTVTDRKQVVRAALNLCVFVCACVCVLLWSSVSTAARGRIWCGSQSVQFL